jgi:UDP-2,3-diacylglucosamine hydrolase
MSVAVIADAHIGGPGGAATPLVEQFEALAGRGCRHLVLLGDLFHIWVGARGFESEDITAIVEALRKLRADGLRVDYIEGNRDFFLAGSIFADAFDGVHTELAFESGGRRYLAIHGDGLDKSDRLYRFWRWLSKNRVSEAMVHVVPAALGRRLVERTERGLAGTNFKHKIRIPQEVILRFARRRLAEGFDAILMGHFHQPRTWRLAAGEVRLLDAWFNTRRVLWLDES